MNGKIKYHKRFKSFILNGKIKYHNIVILYKNIDLNNIINNIYSTFPVAKVAKAHTIFILKFEYYCIIVLCSIIFNLLIFVLDINFQNASNPLY